VYTKQICKVRAGRVFVERWRLFDTSTARYVVGPSGRTRWFSSPETADAAARRLESGPSRQSARVRSFRRVS